MKEQIANMTAELHKRYTFACIDFFSIPLFVFVVIIYLKKIVRFWLAENECVFHVKQVQSSTTSANYK